MKPCQFQTDNKNLSHQSNHVSETSPEINRQLTWILFAGRTFAIRCCFFASPAVGFAALQQGRAH